MKAKICIAAVISLGFSGLLMAQNVGINTTGATPNASAQLDLNTGNTFTSPNGKGLLIPNVALTGTGDATTVGSPATSLFVYNTATAGAGSTAVTAGFYYWDGARWVAFFGSGSKNWSLTGNAGTTASSSAIGSAVTNNFIGTTDGSDFVVAANNLERMRVVSTGSVGIGIKTPGAQLDILTLGTKAVFGHSTNTGAYIGYESTITVGTGSTISPLQTLSGAGVYATNPTAGFTSIFAQSTGGASVAAGIDYSNVWMGRYTYVDNINSNYQPYSSFAQLNNAVAAAGNTNQAAIFGYSANAGTTNPANTIGVAGTAVGNNQDSYGIYGAAYTNSSYSSFGGYFSGNTSAGASYAYAFIGGTANGGGSLRKITGSGSVAEIVPTANHGRITLICPESPEYWYQDYGTIQLVNGKAHVTLDPILVDIIIVDAANPLKVFPQVNIPTCNGVAIMNKTATGFDIVEVNNGTSSGEVDYQIVAKPKTNYGEGRFVQAPGPAWLKPEAEPQSAKAANQPDATKIFHWAPDWVVYGYDVEKNTPIGGVVNAGPNFGKIKIAEGVFKTSVPAQRPTK